jgi:hypothetical protein
MSEEQVQMRGFSIPIRGTYVLIDDVIVAIRSFAQSLDDPELGAFAHEIANWISGGIPPEVDSSPHVGVAPQPLEQIGEAGDTPEVFGAEDGDDSPDVDRVEIYPDPPDDPRPKWYARSIDTGGYIIKVTNGSFDQEWVIQNAQERWPGKSIHLLKNAGDDSKWIEDGTRGVFPSQGPPIRRLWAGAGR